MSSFPPLPTFVLTRDEIVNYLIQCKAKGLCQHVYEQSSNRFIILTGRDNQITVFVGQGVAFVGQKDWSSSLDATWTGKAATLKQLEDAIGRAAFAYGEDWPAPIETARLSATTPATNLATISRLIGLSEIEAVFDPYLDNAALTSLLDILSFGGTISGCVRLLSSTQMTQGNIPRLTRSLVTQWFAERGIASGEVRLMPPREHRRFMLLSGDQSLILGMSLNSITKNEAVRLETDAEDRPFFESVWKGAAAL
jgi:hypothetical protein